MGLINKLMCGATLATALLFGSEAKAQTPETPKISITKTLEDISEETPSREIDFFLEKPRETFEANSNFFYSAHQLIGKGFDLLDEKFEFDSNILPRIGLILLSHYLSYASSYYSHEIAHEYEFRKASRKTRLRISCKQWKSIVPMYVQKAEDYGLLTEENVLRTILHGLNQEEFNSYDIWIKSSLKEKFNFDEATYFLNNKIGDLLYVLSVGFKDKRPKDQDLKLKEFFAHHLKEGMGRDIWNDVDMYVGMLYNKNIHLSKPTYFIQALIADFVSSYTYESLAAIGGYMCNGKRYQKPLMFNLSKNLKISPPIVNQYITTDGSFYNLNWIIKYKNNLLQCSLAHDLDCMGGEVDTLRAGSKYHSPQIAKLVQIKPFLYLNFNRKQPAYKGISTGLEANIEVVKNVFLQGKIEYNKNDLLENRVKSKDNGTKFLLGMNIKF